MLEDLKKESQRIYDELMDLEMQLVEQFEVQGLFSFLHQCNTFV
jgi:hypothetical protein